VLASRWLFDDARMSQLARQQLYFGRHFSLDELLRAIDGVSAEDVQRVAMDLFRDGAPVATVVGPKLDGPITMEQLRA